MSTACRHRRLSVLLAASSLPLAACTPAASSGPAPRSTAAGARPTALADASVRRQRGPVVVIRARLETDHPAGSGRLTLELDGRTVGRAYPGNRGRASFVVDLPGATP